MKLTIDHHTQYHYAEMVRHSTQYLRLTPQTSQRQRIVSWQLDLPEQATITTDGYGNILHVLSLDTPHETIQIHAHGEVERVAQPPLVDLLERPRQRRPAQEVGDLVRDQRRRRDQEEHDDPAPPPVQQRDP